MKISISLSNSELLQKTKSLVQEERRVTREIPAVRGLLRSGELSITNAAKIQVAARRVLKRQPRAAAQKKTEDLVTACLNLSRSACDRTLLSELPELKQNPKFTERTRALDESLTELKLVVNSELQAKIDRLLNK